MVTMRVGRVSAMDAVNRLATVDGIPGLVPVLRHVTLGVGDTAVVQLADGRSWVQGVIGATAPSAPTPDPGGVDGAPTPPALPPAQPVSEALRPQWSGSWRDGAWRTDTSDLYQGDYTGRGINSGGCWWGRLPSGLLSAVVTLVRNAGAGAGGALSPTMTLLAGTSRPAGAATVLSSVAGPAIARGKSAQWTVPAGWLAQLDAGTAGGIGITSGGSASPYLALVASGVGMTLALSRNP